MNTNNCIQKVVAEGDVGTWAGMPAVVRKITTIEHNRHPILLACDVEWPTGVHRVVCYLDEFTPTNINT